MAALPFRRLWRNRQAEEARAHLRATLDASPAPILMLSPDLRVVRANRAFRETLGDVLAPGQSLIGRAITEMRSEIARVFEDGPGIVRRLAQRTKDRTTWFETEVRQHWPEERQFMVQSSPVWTDDGAYLGRLMAFRDVTDERATGRLQKALAAEIRAHHTQLESELLRAAEVQRMLLPARPPQIPGFAVAVHYLPARTVGGDFYDWWQPRPGLLNIVIGDVSGKGAPASILMASVRAILRATAGEARPAAVLKHAAPFLSETLREMGAFTTLFLAQLDIGARRLRYVDAGHGLAIVRRGGVVKQAAGPRSLPIGVDPNDTYIETFIDLAPGDAVAAFTDGLLETGDERICRPVDEIVALVPEFGDAHSIARSLLASHAGLAANDDVAMLVLEATADAVTACEAA